MVWLRYQIVGYCHSYCESFFVIHFFPPPNVLIIIISQLKIYSFLSNLMAIGLGENQPLLFSKSDRVKLVPLVLQFYASIISQNSLSETVSEVYLYMNRIVFPPSGYLFV